jgi:hypothetical protein
MILEWVRRGFKNSIPTVTLGDKVFDQVRALVSNNEYLPPWMHEYQTISKVAASHRSNLLRKDPKWYGQFGWTEPDDLPYFWPVTKADIQLKRVMEFCV